MNGYLDYEQNLSDPDPSALPEKVARIACREMSFFPSTLVAAEFWGVAGSGDGRWALDGLWLRGGEYGGGGAGTAAFTSVNTMLIYDGTGTYAYLPSPEKRAAQGIGVSSRGQPRAKESILEDYMVVSSWLVFVRQTDVMS
ncbi:hypothetical protein EKO27_g4858 [Xylaria grammica]|uniref:Uncharacterized protein n=1 Tax=Xylaria grammica TaxID=363999 RepID=A0A439D791_9PEZI|nr:hypothetical protein EKO27_g4858 [Xylaria grammica]